MKRLTNITGVDLLKQIRKAVVSLAEQYKTKEHELDSFKNDYGVRSV